MTGFSIAINAWGVHSILHKALSASEIALWQAALREAADRCDGTGRKWSLVADVRGIGGAEGAALLPTVVPVLLGIVTSPAVERCAVIAADAGQADLFGQAAGGMDLSRKTRILAVEGRDRVQIAAAYGWALNGTQPGAARNVPAGAVLRFPKATPRHLLGTTLHTAIRKAS